MPSEACTRDQSPFYRRPEYREYRGRRDATRRVAAEWGPLVLHHVLDPVIAIRRQIRNPVEAIVSRPALPKKAKAQKVLVELILVRRALDMYAEQSVTEERARERPRRTCELRRGYPSSR